MQKIFTALYRYKWWIFVYSIALVIRVGLAIPLVHDWDGFVFSQSAKNLLKGITPYKTVQTNSPVIYPDSDVPMTEQWYGYPPLPLLMFTFPYALLTYSGIYMSSIMQNFVLKIPFIMGDLLFAFLAAQFLNNKSKKLARKVTLLILFNPLLIWISSAWGMFDIWIVNVILLFLLCVRSKRVVLAGIFIALAPQIKLFPIFFLPAVFIYFFQCFPETSSRIRFILTMTLVTLFIDVPFFLSSPQGFMNQNLIMHMARPAQGIGIIAILEYLGYIYRFNIAVFEKIGGLLMLASIIIFNLYSLIFIRKKESKLLYIIFLIYTSILLFNKVVNEQYFVVLVGLLILLTHLPKSEHYFFNRKVLVIFETITTITVLIAAVVLGFHFLTFLPPFIANGLLKSSTDYLVFYLSRLIPQLPLYTYPNSIWTYYNLPVTIVYVLLIPLIVCTCYVTMKGFSIVLQSRRVIVTYINSITIPKISRHQVNIGILSIFVLCILCIPFLHYLHKTNALKLVDLIDTKAKVVFPKYPRVGTFYDVWWNNPSHVPAFADDAWNKTTLTPLNGYYTSKNSFFVEHIKEMKYAGIDFALIPYHLYDRERYLTFGYYAERLGLYYAPMIELIDVLGSDVYRPTTSDGQKMLGSKVSEKSRTALENVFISSLAENIHSKALLRMNGKPVVFVFFADWFVPSWDKQSRDLLVQNIIDKYSRSNDNPFHAISKAWKMKIASRNDILKYYPNNIKEFNQNNSIDSDYKTAFLTSYENFWKDLRHTVEAKTGKVILFSTYPPFNHQSALDPASENELVMQFQDFPKIHVFDGEYFYGISSTWYSWRYYTKHLNEIQKAWELQLAQQALRNRSSSRPLILTITPEYDERLVRPYNPYEPIPFSINGENTYDWGWKTALKYNPDLVLITSWNEFFEGTAIEPTKEHGDYYLHATKQWVSIFKRQPLARLNL